MLPIFFASVIRLPGYDQISRTNLARCLSMNRVQDGRFNFYEHVPQVQ